MRQRAMTANRTKKKKKETKIIFKTFFFFLGARATETTNDYKRHTEKRRTHDYKLPAPSVFPVLPKMRTLVS